MSLAPRPRMLSAAGLNRRNRPCSSATTMPSPMLSRMECNSSNWSRVARARSDAADDTLFPACVGSAMRLLVASTELTSGLSHMLRKTQEAASCGMGELGYLREAEAGWQPAPRHKRHASDFLAPCPVLW